VFLQRLGIFVFLFFSLKFGLKKKKNYRWSDKVRLDRSLYIKISEAKDLSDKKFLEKFDCNILFSILFIYVI